MSKTRFISIGRKWLFVMLGLLSGSLGIFFILTYATFLDDKRLFVLDLNLSVLESAKVSVTHEIQSRVETLARRTRAFYAGSSFFDSGTSSTLREEVLRAQIIDANTGEPTKTFINERLLKSRGINTGIFQNLDKTYPLQAKGGTKAAPLSFFNHSIALSQKTVLPVFTIALQANNSSQFLVIDLLNTFVTESLKRSDVAEIYLVKRNGELLAHPSLETLLNSPMLPATHPVISKISTQHAAKESFLGKISGEESFISIADTAFPDVYVVSQIPKARAFQALLRLTRNSLFLLTIVIWGAVIISRFLVKRLTSNIQRLRQAAESVGKGDLNVKVEIKSRDEVQKVAESFQWMVGRIQELLTETAQKTRMEEELKTASLVQSTLLQHADLSPDWPVEIVPYYLPATECGGDFWDLQWNGSKITVVLGDATGHGASAAIITAVAKSFFATSQLLQPTSALTPDKFLENLNKIIYNSCRGKLLMTLCLVQLDTDTGELTICNAGHESPMAILPAAAGQVNPKPDTLFAKGERLGFSPDSTYEKQKFTLSLGHTVLLYTDGISEAQNPEGKEFSERAIRKLLTQAAQDKLPDLRDRIVQAVDRHRNLAPQKDDITFVLLRWLKSNSPRKLTA